MIEVENTDVNIVRNFIPMRNHMPASAYGLKAISDWFVLKRQNIQIDIYRIRGKDKDDSDWSEISSMTIVGPRGLGVR